MPINNKAAVATVLSQEEVNELREKITASNLDAEAQSQLLKLMDSNSWLYDQLRDSKISIKKLRKLFGFKNESLKNNPSSSDQEGEKDQGDRKKETDGKTRHTKKQSNSDSTTPTWNSTHNHGRYSVNDYTGCPVTHIPFSDPALQKGLCPECAKCNTEAKVTPEQPQVLVFLTGQPLISGRRYALNRVRCLICKTYFTAPLPQELVNRPKYAPSCITSTVIHHYYGGMPFKRIEKLQKLQGVPFADATQFDYVNGFYTTVVAPVVQVLKECAANGDSLFFDDSPGRILEQIATNKQNPKNKSAVHVTVLLSVYENHRIYLFNTTTLTAGKEFANLLKDRTSDIDFTTMTDASANNFPNLNDDLMAKWVITLCLCHGRRHFVDLLDDGDEDIKLVLNIIANIYKNEQHCKQTKLTDEQRLHYHQTHSAPLMSALHTWLNNLMLYKKVEPNSALGKAITYLLKRWYWLTQFLRVLGAALDNNICEIAVKIAIRYKKSSVFYKTFYGATIGDAMMSLLHTAAYADVNIFDYLNVLQYFATEVQAAPEQWLPWNYQSTIRILNAKAHDYKDTG